MKSIATIVAVICITSLICSLVSVISPQGNTKRILNTVLGAFILCSMLLPIKNTISDYKFNISVTQPEGDLTASADEAYNRAVIIETKANLENTLFVYLSNNRIIVEDISIQLDSYENGGIYISEINIYINNNYKKDVTEIIRLTKKKFDIKPHIYVR